MRSLDSMETGVVKAEAGVEPLADTVVVMSARLVGDARGMLSFFLSGKESYNMNDTT